MSDDRLNYARFNQLLDEEEEEIIVSIIVLMNIDFCVISSL